MRKWLCEIGGWSGMVLIHGATLPVTISVLAGYSDHLPPLTMMVAVTVGLFLYLIRALARWDWLYIVSNTIGFFANSAVVALILTRGAV